MKAKRLCHGVEVTRAQRKKQGLQKEGSMSVVVAYKGKLLEVVSLDLHYNKKGGGMSPVHAFLYVRKGLACSYGSAGGSGYCKRSAAVAAAIDAAGIELSEDIDGRGMHAVIDALIAIARMRGYRGQALVVES